MRCDPRSHPGHRTILMYTILRQYIKFLKNQSETTIKNFSKINLGQLYIISQKLIWDNYIKKSIWDNYIKFFKNQSGTTI